jgi:hypothetical protein
MAKGLPLKPRNIAILLCCAGPLVVLIFGASAEWLAHCPTGEPSDEKAAFYEQAAILCVTGVMGGSLIFFVGLCMTSYLLLRRLVLGKTADNK